MAEAQEIKVSQVATVDLEAVAKVTMPGPVELLLEMEQEMLVERGQAATLMADGAAVAVDILAQV
jgi:hypothetical protein